ncbi:kinase-like domain-containing protein [Cladochytrium replicatum]|nr:kinase-like domain-containing protein [Cladochytrium replicatum]
MDATARDEGTSTSTKRLPSFQGRQAMVHSISRRTSGGSDVSLVDNLEKPQLVIYPRKSVVAKSQPTLRGGNSLRSINGSGSIARRTTQRKAQESIEPNTSDNNVIGIEIGRTSIPSHVPRYSTPSVKPAEGINNNQEYYEYLMLSQRHSSSNFIQKIDSAEVVWKQPIKNLKLIGPYLLGEQIGKGAFGKVKEGLCSETLQRVAVKIISKKRVRKVQNGVANIIREIRLLRRLKHKNIIKLIDVYCKVEDNESNVGMFNWFQTIEEEPILWADDNGITSERHVEVLKWYLIFEYCPYSLQTLLDQSATKCLSVAHAHWFFVQAIDGLSYLHAQKVIHRDIKPGNMLITADGVLKITDFGISEQFSVYEPGEMYTSAFAGTHQFISPEVAEGVSDCRGDKVDVWASGVMLYNLVTGRYPFEIDEEGNLLLLYEKIISGQFQIPSTVDPVLSELIIGMLDKEPSKRFSVGEVMSHPWICSTFNQSVKPIISQRELSTENQTPKTDFATKKRDLLKLPSNSTMIEFLDELFGQTIEEVIAKAGMQNEHGLVVLDRHDLEMNRKWWRRILSNKPRK